RERRFPTATASVGVIASGQWGHSDCGRGIRNVALLCITAKLACPCPLMGWSGRAPAPPAGERGKGRRRRGARHVTQAQCRNRRDRYRYRQELVSRRGSRSAWRDRPAPEVVSWPSRRTARQPGAVSHWHGGLRRRTPSEPQTHIAWSRCSANASQICASLLEGAEERLP